jgi:hypothetical protein
MFGSFLEVSHTGAARPIFPAMHNCNTFKNRIFFSTTSVRQYLFSAISKGYILAPLVRMLLSSCSFNRFQSSCCVVPSSLIQPPPSPSLTLTSRTGPKLLLLIPHTPHPNAAATHPLLIISEDMKAKSCVVFVRALFTGHKFTTEIRHRTVSSPMLSELLACAQRIAKEISAASPSRCEVALHSSVADSSANAAASEPDPIQANLATIRAMLQTTTFADLGMCCTIESLLSESSRSRSIQFYDVLDDPAISVCLIAFPPGTCIPLHDHPGMHVFTKVLSGELSFTMLDLDRPMPCAAIESGTAVLVQNLRTVTLNDGACCELSPITGNIHGVSCASDRTSLMLDVCVPPYTDDICHYFAPTASNGQLCVIDEALAWSCRHDTASIQSTANTISYGASSSGAKGRLGHKRS